jgi:hypothetical protein
MSTALASGTIGTELRADVDYLLKDETLPDNTSVTSNGMLLGKTQNAIDIVGYISTQVELADTKAMTFTLQSSSDDGSTDAYADVIDIYTKTASGAETVAVGELFRYTISTDKELYFRVKWTSTDTGEVGVASVYPVYIPR